MRIWIIAGLAWAGLCGGALAKAPVCLLSVQEDGGALAQYNLASGETHLVPVGAEPHEVDVTPDGRTAFVSQFGMRDFSHEIGSAGDHISRIDLRAGASSAQFALPGALRGPHGVKLRPGGREVFTNAEIGDAMVVFDVRTGAVRRTFPLPAHVHAFTFSHDGRAVFAFALADGVYKLDAETGAVLAHADLGSPARSVQVSRNGRELLVAARGEVVFLDTGDLAVLRRFAVSGVTQVIYASMDEAAGLVLAPAPGEDVAVFLDIATGAERARVALGHTPTSTAFGPDGRAYINNVGDTFVTAVDLSDFSATRVGAFQRPNGLAFGACPR
jgi:DNA-binding beta-propeller fold protein YncE